MRIADIRATPVTVPLEVPLRLANGEILGRRLRDRLPFASHLFFRSAEQLVAEARALKKRIPPDPLKWSPSA
jgi:hypothetical protein